MANINVNLNAYAAEEGKFDLVTSKAGLIIDGLVAAPNTLLANPFTALINGGAGPYVPNPLDPVYYPAVGPGTFTVLTSSQTQNRVLVLPDATGTIAVIPSGSSLFTSSSATVAVGTFKAGTVQYTLAASLAAGSASAAVLTITGSHIGSSGLVALQGVSSGSSIAGTAIYITSVVWTAASAANSYAGSIVVTLTNGGANPVLAPTITLAFLSN